MTESGEIEPALHDGESDQLGLQGIKGGPFFRIKGMGTGWGKQDWR